MVAFCRFHVLISIFGGHDHFATLMSWDTFVVLEVPSNSRCMLGARNGACPLAPSLMLDFLVVFCEASLFLVCHSILEEKLKKTLIF